MSIVKSFASVLMNRAAAGVLGVATTFIAAKMLSPADFGVLVAVLASVAIVVRILSLGFGQASQYFGALSVENETENSGGLAISILFVVGLSSICVLFFDGFFSRFLLPDGGGYKAAFQYFVLLVPLCIVHLNVSLFFLGRREIGKYSILSIVPVIVCFVSIALCFFFEKNKEAAWLSYATQYVSSGVLAFALTSGMFSSMFRFVRKSIAAFFKMALYGAKSYVVSTISFSAGRIAIVVSAWYVSSEDVATYSIARTIGEAVILVYGSIGPLLLSYVAGKEQGYGHEFLGKACRITLIILIPLAIVIAAAAPVALHLFFGEKYSHVSTLLWILLPGVVISTQQRTLENYIYGRNKQVHLLGTHLIITFLIFAFTSLLGDRYGVDGVAFATSLCNLALFLMTGYVAYKYDDLHPKLYVCPRKDDVKLVLDRFRRLRA